MHFDLRFWWDEKCASGFVPPMSFAGDVLQHQLNVDLIAGPRYRLASYRRGTSDSDRQSNCGSMVCLPAALDRMTTVGCSLTGVEPGGEYLSCYREL